MTERTGATPKSSAGVLELLRQFKADATAADGYATVRPEQAKAIEPVLRAFEYLPVDVARKSGPLSGIPVAIKDIIVGSYRQDHRMLRVAKWVETAIGFDPGIPNVGRNPSPGERPLNPAAANPT
jgi:Asp-tRNA(Asn)/Glu-tRNA(Gln) amidotransferase A subunit family amidase